MVSPNSVNRLRLWKAAEYEQLRAQDSGQTDLSSNAGFTPTSCVTLGKLLNPSEPDFLIYKTNLSAGGREGECED